ncbi:MAG: prepilin-type N-terminal cleavage/methylation domain-containing protein [Halioglobus sp.]|nr:prepilin-type N-terminal cleavage/methylation domain-containing protein [Halioglobus sp.]
MASLDIRPGRGFTLLELVVALAIVAVILGVSVPAMQNFYESSQYRGAISDVVSLLGSARYTAIRTGNEQDVFIYPRERKISSGKASRVLPDGIRLEVLGSAELNQDSAGVIRFYPDGGASGGYINVASENGNVVQVQVDWLLGRVSTCTDNCEGMPL